MSGHHYVVVVSLLVVSVLVGSGAIAWMRHQDADREELVGLVRECESTTEDCLDLARELKSRECRVGYLVCGPQEPDGARPDCDSFEETWPVPCGPHDRPCEILLQGPVLYVERCLEAPYPP